MRLTLWPTSRRKHQFKGPVHMYPFLFKNGDSFLRFGLLSTCIGWKRSLKTQLFKNALQGEDFWKRWLLVQVWTDEDGCFRIRWCNTSFTTSITHAQRGCYRSHIVKRFVWTGENALNTLRVDAYIFKNGGFCPLFLKIYGYVWTGPKSSELQYFLANSRNSPSGRLDDGFA